MPTDNLPILTFQTACELRAWLVESHDNSEGIWVRIFRKRSAIQSVTFGELLDEGLCFGWSESMRHSYDMQSYLQRFTPCKTMETQSKRNLERVHLLIQEGKMTLAGLKALEDAL